MSRTLSCTSFGVCSGCTAAASAGRLIACAMATGLAHSPISQASVPAKPTASTAGQNIPGANARLFLSEAVLDPTGRWVATPVVIATASRSLAPSDKPVSSISTAKTCGIALRRLAGLWDRIIWRAHSAPRLRNRSWYQKIWRATASETSPAVALPVEVSQYFRIRCGAVSVLRECRPGPHPATQYSSAQEPLRSECWRQAFARNRN